MSEFECKVSDLMKKKESSENINTNEINSNIKITETSTSKSLFELLDDVSNIKTFLITLLIYLIIHSELFINILINTFEFLNSSGRINLIGSVLLFSITILTFSYLS